jgi:esterase/lipase superfamily enzyme
MEELVEPLSDVITEILDRIVDALASGDPVPADLLRELERRWQAERSEDARGLQILLKSIGAQPNLVALGISRSRVDDYCSTSAAHTGEWRRLSAKSPKSAAGAGEKEPGWLYPVFFGTNRAAADPQHPEKGFNARRAREVTYGQCDVWIPATHRFGETGEPWWQRWPRLQFADDHLRLRQLVVLDPRGFWAGLQAEMLKADRGKRHGLVYLHGYNVGFEDAAIRAAQMGFDLRVSGATAFFSWPSQGTLEGYPADAASIEASENAIVCFLADFVHQSGAEVVHVVAHSMGNRGLLRALQRFAADPELNSAVRFGQIFLAAPDVDRDLFLDLARLYPNFSTRTTLYASDADRALGASAWLHDDYRAGYCPPVTVPGIARFDTIRVPNFDLDLVGHGYYAEADALLNDLHELMNHDTPPEQRQRLRRVADYWQMVR